MRKSLVSLVALVAAVPGGAFPQWAEQVVDLGTGWNAVYLEVDPVPGLIDEVFAPGQVESVWMWNRRFSSMEFLTEPSVPVQGSPDWLVWVPASMPQAATRTLDELIGGRSYLIKARTDVARTLTGRPVMPSPEWVGASYNLAGFSFTSPGPTVAQFYGPVQELGGLDVRAFTIVGDWQRLEPGARLVGNVPYFVFAGAPSGFRGPFQLESMGLDGVAFGDVGARRSLVVRNTSASPLALTVSLLPSATPPLDQPVNAGAVPLLVQRDSVATESDTSDYEPFEEGTSRQYALGPGQSRQLTFAMDATRLAPPPVEVDFLYQGLLQFGNSDGFVVKVPVSATGFAGEEVAGSQGRMARRVTADSRKSASGPVVDGKGGLWVGEVRIDKVSNVASAPNVPVPAGQDLRQRLILHADSTSDAVRLVQQVAVLTREAESGTKVALVTDESKLNDDYGGSTLAGGTLSGVRFSAVSYPFFRFTGEPANTLRGSGNFEDGTATRADSVSFSYTMDYRDKLNPFVHKYHPDHDNLDAQFAATPLPEGRESFSVRHEVTLDFLSTDPDPLAGGITPPGWMGTEVGGRYTEKIYGLFRSDYSVRQTELLYKRLGASAYWTFDEATGNSVREEISGATGTMTGTGRRAPGRVGNAWDASGNQLAYPANSGMDMPQGPEPFTISVWINPRVLFAATYLITWGGGHINGIVLNQNQVVNHWFGGGADLTAPFVAASRINRWSHLAVTYDGAVRRIYVDGAQVATDTQTARVGAGPVEMGRNISGLLDEMSIYKRALSVEEIGQLAGLGAAGNSAYRETPITVSGYFKLNRVSTETALNPPATVLEKGN